MIIIYIIIVYYNKIMSWGTCYSASNNIHFDLPPLMSDGRNYTNYKTPSTVNENIIRNNNIRTNNDYIRFLTNNAEKLIGLNHVRACGSVGNTDFNTTMNRKYFGNNKYLYKSCEDKSQPFGYESSDLKNIYLTRQQLQSRMVSPILSQQGYLEQM
jgi:hypothetical protein